LADKEIKMFGSIGVPELIIIFAIALLIFGPKKLPEVGRSIGRALREFRKTSDEIKGKIEEEIQAEEFREMKKDFEDITDIKGSTSLEDLGEPQDSGKSKPPKKKKSTAKKDIKENAEGNKVT
jgi:TatA/E family protein of Tat protein translocase